LPSSLSEHFLAFDYVALGHLHQPQMKGTDYIRYSGSLMKYSFSEQHHKKAMTLVELNKEGFVSASQIPLNAPHNMRIVEGELDQILRKVYPNVLHLEKPGMLIGVDQEMGKARLARGEMEMFKDFFLEAKQEALTEAQEQAVSAVIQSLKQGE